MRRVARSAFLALALALVVVAMTAGCAASPAGRSFVRYERGAAAYRVKAPEAGRYALYAGDESEPRVTAEIEPGEMVGFERDAEGRLVAVAGETKLVLPDGSYTWRRP